MDRAQSIAGVLDMLESELNADSLAKVLTAIAALLDQDSTETTQEIKNQVTEMAERNATRIRVY